MRLLLPLVALAALLAGCETRQPAAATHPSPPAVALPPPAQVAQPSVVPNLSQLGSWVNTGDTSAARRHLTLDGQPWHVRTAARADYTRPLTFRPAADAHYHVPAALEKGPDVQYSFQLLSSHGQPRFTTHLRKANFASVVPGDLRTAAPAAPPVFLAYWPARQALVFEVSFVRDGTDDGQTVLVLLDATTGRVLHLAPGKNYMGSCDCWPTLTPDERTVLTGDEILSAAGPVVPLAQPNLVVAGTAVLNDSTFLVVYEGDSPTLANNAHIVSRTGQVRHRFTFHGTDRNMSGGGFHLAAALLPGTNTYYLYDGAARVLTLLPVRAPTALRQWPAAQLTPFQEPQRPAEQRLEFLHEDMTSAVLYVDTVTRHVRFADLTVQR